jgi:hypothetical protein
MQAPLFMFRVLLLSLLLNGTLYVSATGDVFIEIKLARPILGNNYRIIQSYIKQGELTAPDLFRFRDFLRQKIRQNKNIIDGTLDTGNSLYQFLPLLVLPLAITYKVLKLPGHRVSNTGGTIDISPTLKIPLLSLAAILFCGEIFLVISFLVRKIYTEEQKNINELLSLLSDKSVVEQTNDKQKV